MINRDMPLPLLPVVLDTLRFVGGSLGSGRSGELKDEEGVVVLVAVLVAFVADLVVEAEVEPGRRVGAADCFALCRWLEDLDNEPVLEKNPGRLGVSTRVNGMLSDALITERFPMAPEAVRWRAKSWS